MTSLIVLHALINPTSGRTPSLDNRLIEAQPNAAAGVIRLGTGLHSPALGPPACSLDAVRSLFNHGQRKNGRGGIYVGHRGERRGVFPRRRADKSSVDGRANLHQAPECGIQVSDETSKTCAPFRRRLPFLLSGMPGGRGYNQPLCGTGRGFSNLSELVPSGIFLMEQSRGHAC